MKYFFIVFVLFTTVGCSIEEHNRKAVADRALRIEAFKKEVFENAIETEITMQPENMLTITHIPESEAIIYFTNEGHPAHPSFLKQNFPLKEEDSMWFLASAATKEEFTDWVVEFWNNKNSLPKEDVCVSTKTRFKFTSDCRLFYGGANKYYKQSFFEWVIDSINECRCQKKNGQ